MSGSKSWNRPDSSQKIVVTKNRSLIKGLAAGLIVALIGGTLTWFLSSDRKPSIKNGRDVSPLKIVEIKPVVSSRITTEDSRNVPTNLVKRWDGKMVEWPPKNAYMDEKGNWRHPGGQACFDPRPKPHIVGSKTRQIFEHVSENQVANLLTATPGKQYFGTMPLFKSKKFRDDFVQALISPTEIKDTDSEYDKSLKYDVRVAMKEIEARVKAGEDLSDILTETRKELQRLGQYKQDVIKDLKDAMRGNILTDDEVKDYIGAANIMLEQKGITPMSVSELAIQNLRRNVERFNTNKQEVSKEK